MVHDNRGFDYDAEWMQGAVRHQRSEAAKGFNPRLIKGHTPEDRDKRREAPAAGFLDNYKFDGRTGWLRADFVGLTQETADEIKDNKWPGRSVEVIPDKFDISAVAMLGESPPFFKLPDMRFRDDTKPICYSVELNAMPENDEKTVKFSADELFEKFEKYMGDPEKDEDDISEEERKLFQKFMKMMEEKKCETEKKASDEAREKYADDPDLRKKYDGLIVEVAELKDENERSAWRQKFDAKRIPEGRIDVDENIDLIMDMKPDNRQKYFDNITGAIQRPAQGETMKDAKSDDGKGSEAELESFKKYCDENKDKYNFAQSGEYSQAMKDYRAERKSG